MRQDAVHKKEGYVINDTLAIRVEMESMDNQRNAGLTKSEYPCINPVLQALYHIPLFRKALFLVDTDHQRKKNVTQALQSIFYHLQCGNVPVGTAALIMSFWWIFKRDLTAQELYDVFIEEFQHQKENPIEQLFQGNLKIWNFKSESFTVESFQYLALATAWCNSLMESLEDFLAVKKENDSTPAPDKKFISLPPTLHMHLQNMMEERHPFVFPATLDMSKFMSDDSADLSPPIFHLQSLLVHSQETDCLEYVYIRPSTKEEWFKVENEIWERATIEQVLDSGRGGQQGVFSNAYSLIYLREADIPSLLTPFPNSDIPKALMDKFDYLQVNVVTDADLCREWRHLAMKLGTVKTLNIKRTATVCIT
jgi:ubiquitin carboxyl-terminal hydrolase 7